MKRLRVLGVCMGVLCAVSLLAGGATAFALPDVAVTLAGGTYPLRANSEVPKARTAAESATGLVFEGIGVSILLLATELSALGTYTSTYNEVEYAPNKEKCHTGTEAAGTVVSGGEYHVVPLPPASSGKVGLLFLVSEFLATCGTIKTLFRGDVLGSLNAGSEGVELTSFDGALLGENAKQKLSEYINDTGSIVKAKLESDFGLEFVAIADNVSEELATEVAGSQMVVITGR